MKNYFLLSFLIATTIVQAQWRGYFSYRQIKDLTIGTHKVFAASENALFVHDVVTGETTTLNTIDGLSSETISTVFFLQERNSLYIGYENGLLSIYNFTNQTVTNFIEASGVQVLHQAAMGIVSNLDVGDLDAQTAYDLGRQADRPEADYVNDALVLLDGVKAAWLPTIESHADPLPLLEQLERVHWWTEGEVAPPEGEDAFAGVPAMVDAVLASAGPRADT